MDGLVYFNILTPFFPSQMYRFFLNILYIFTENSYYILFIEYS